MRKAAIGIVLTAFILLIVVQTAFGVYGVYGGSRVEKQPSSTAYAQKGQVSTEEFVDESKLKCRDNETLKERVRCRLRNVLSEEKLDYMPEECKALEGKKRKDCLLTYEKVHKCLFLPNKTARYNCLKNKLEIDDIETEKMNCADLTCKTKLREKVFNYVKFRLYELQEKAEKLLERGADEIEVVDFIAKLDGAKVEFNNATSIDAKKAVLKKVQGQWKEFKSSAVMTLKAKKYAEKFLEKVKSEGKK